MKKYFFTFFIASMALNAAANTVNVLDSPVGRWKIIDEKTGQLDSVVELKEVDSSIEAVIVENYSKEKICSKCKGESLNKDIVGMKILTGLKKKGSEWGDGKIFDPKTGETYSVKISLVEKGQRLKVRGYMGISLIGVTLYWQRE